MSTSRFSLRTLILTGSLILSSEGGRAATYSYADGENNPTPIYFTENSLFTVATGSATQSGEVVWQNGASFGRDGAGTLTLASWSSMGGVNFYGGTTILNSSDASYFTDTTVDSTVGGGPILRVDGSRLGGYALDVGLRYGGEFQLTNGGSYYYTNAAVLGYFANSNGRVLISGAGSVLDARGLQMIVGRLGQGSLTLSDGGMITSTNSDRSIHLGEQSTGRGTINIGAASGQAAVAPGIVNLNQISGGAGGGTIVFNHTSNNYVFTQNGTAAGAIIWVRDAIAFRIENGTTTLHDINTNTGDTTVTGGTLLISTVAAPYSVLGTGQLKVEQNGTLGGVGTVKGSATIAGTLAPGNSAGLISFEGGLAFESTAKILMELGGYTRGTGYDGIDVTGALSLNGQLYVNFINGFLPDVGDSFTLFGGSYTSSGNFASPVTFSNGYFGTFNSANGQVLVTAVPEPSSVALLVIGLGALYFRFRKRVPRVCHL